MADVVAGAASDTGSFRDHNEDAVRCWDAAERLLDSNGMLFALADGMGGHSHGEVASAEALKVLFERYYQAPVASSEIALVLKQAFRAANNRLFELGAAKGADQMMGTTLVAGVIREKLLVVANVGDSRAYILRGGRAQQVSVDHSLVAEQVKEGLLTPEQARTSRNRNVITRALGHQGSVDPDIFEVPLLPKDAVLLASDGLYNTVGDAEMATTATTEEPDRAAQMLVKMAAERQSTDNASAVVIHFQPEAAFATAIGQDLFKTAPVPRPEPVGRRLPAALIAAALTLLALLALLAFLFFSQLLPPLG